jgi:hypothetical protein
MSDALLKARESMREEQRRKNRELMPNLAALMDEIKEQFPDARLVWGEDLETGHTVGKKTEEEYVFYIPKNYFPCATHNTNTRKAKR